MGQWIELRDKRDRLRGRYHPGTGVLELAERRAVDYWPLASLTETMVSRLRAVEYSTAVPQKSAEPLAVSGQDGD